MSEVFVSYKAEDRKRVRPLVEALRSDGYSVWWDEQIGGGAAWRHAIETELNAAGCVIVVWSKRSVGIEGEFVQDEATRAKERHVYVPVTIDKVHLPLGFGETQALPLIGWRGDRSDARYRAVLEAVAKNVGDKERAPVHANGQRGVGRRTVIAGGTLAAAAITGAGAWAVFKSRSQRASSDTIAVLPFENLSGDPGQAYFSDGIAEEIRGALARLGGLTVIGRTSSEAVRGDDAPTAARKLGVANILTGSVRRSPTTIRIAAELVDGQTGADRWSQDYDRSPGDTIKIQTDIAENVANAMSAALGRAARLAITVGGTNSADAYNLYLKARAQLRADDSEAGLRSAIDTLSSATTIDPRFASALALKAAALAHLNAAYTLKGISFAPGYARAAVVARQAVEIAPDLVAAHMALARILMQQLDLGAARAEFERGHALAGGNAEDLLAYGDFVSVMGNQIEALDFARRAQVSDPLNPDPHKLEGQALLRGRRFEDAIGALRKSLELAPNRLLEHGLIGDALVLSGRPDEAIRELQKLPADYLFRIVLESIVFARQGNRAGADAAIARVRQIFGDAANYQYAQILAQRGEKDLAFAALDRAWFARDPGLVLMKTDGLLDPISHDPRFAGLLRKMNVPL